MARVFLTAGHNKALVDPIKKINYKEDPGAVSGIYKEADLTIEIRDLTTAALKAKGVTVFNDANTLPLAKMLNWLFPSMKENDIVCEFHWNAGPPTATGAEILVKAYPPASDSEKALAKKVLDATCKTLGIRSRGVKTEADSQHKKLGLMRAPVKTKVILLEVCFITNVTDMNSYNKSKTALAEAIAKVLAEEAKK